MKNKVLDTIKKFHMLNENDVVVVGVSGGADSMSLLHVLLELKDILKIKIVVAHVNHCLRAEESLRDEIFVKNFCDENNVEFNVLKIDVAAEAKKRSMGVEECGREIRYNFFYSLIKGDNYKIATAHTLSDNIETVFLNLTRGSGLNGLCGIPSVRNEVVRPLICVRRDEVEKYCKKNNLSFVVDTSNLSRDYARNKIRLDVIPALKKINPSFETSFSRMISTVSTENDYLDMVSNDYLDRDVSCIRNLHVSIKTRVVMKIVKRKCGIILEKNHVDLILSMIDKNSGAVNIPGNFFVFVNDQGRLDVLSYSEKKDCEKKFLTEKWTVPFELGSIKVCDNTNINFDLISLTSEHNHKKIVKILNFKKLQFNNALDYDKIRKSVVLRNRRPGDFFVPRNRNVKKKLKSFFNELKFPVDKRSSVVLLADKSEVLWIEGIGVSENFKVTQNTKNVLVISLERR